jgi:hypothetical protein
MASERQRDPHLRWPGFRPAFDPDPVGVGWYLELLNLSQRPTEAVRVVTQCVATATDPNTEIEALWEELDWRFHLVGAVGLLALPDRRPAVDLLWRRLEQGSWVAPQLCATAALADPEFVRGASLLIESSTSRERVEPAELLVPRPPWAVDGDPSWEPHTIVLFDLPKTVAALAALLDYPLTDEQAAMIARDHYVGRIAIDWTARIQHAFAETGSPLRRPWGQAESPA